MARFDDIAELHAFAARIGLRRSLFQAKGWPRDHYDVTESKRHAAIKARGDGDHMAGSSSQSAGGSVVTPGRLHHWRY